MLVIYVVYWMMWEDMGAVCSIVLQNEEGAGKLCTDSVKGWVDGSFSFTRDKHNAKCSQCAHISMLFLTVHVLLLVLCSHYLRVCNI